VRYSFLPPDPHGGWLLEEADRIRDRSRIAKLTLYIPVKLFDPQNEGALRYLFSQMQALKAQGVIIWATQGEVYDTYVAWNEK
jgi:hypothetical protein